MQVFKQNEDFEKRVSAIYARLPAVYERRQRHMVALKERAARIASLKEGDAVLVFCCGTGMEFASIIDRIGSTGKILGIDNSPSMLAVARERMVREGWKNVELVQADVTEVTFDPTLFSLFDAGFCTLALSIIVEWRRVYENFVSFIREGGTVVIADMQLASGWRGLLNPISVLASVPFGGTYEGHAASQAIVDLMRESLHDVRKEEFLLGSYFFALGTK